MEPNVDTGPARSILSAGVGAVSILLLSAILVPSALGQVPTVPAEPPPPPPGSLKMVPVPMASGLSEYVADRDAAIRLGKALFWDMQVGSDGTQACASCHFHAGADNRRAGQLNPGTSAGDSLFSTSANWTASLPAFPFRRLADMRVASSEVLAETNDVMSSQGVLNERFVRVRPGYAREFTRPVTDDVFAVGGVPVRQVPPRNSPSVINSVFNFHNFWDGRANETFNGQSPYGPADTDAWIFADTGGGLERKRLEMRNASLASQAVGPLVSDVEMRAADRPNALLGRKLYSLRPLGRQLVHPQDSVLGPLARTRVNARGELKGQPGLTTWYDEMVRQAFRPQYWASTEAVTIAADGVLNVAASGESSAAVQFTQMEANFPLFFGLALMAYQSTLVSDDTPFDRWREGDGTALTTKQRLGLQVFSDVNRGRCLFCHGGAEFTNAAARGILAEGRVELMAMMDPGNAFYDTGFYNIGVRPQAHDPGRGGSAPFINSVTGEPLPLSDSLRGLLMRDGQLPPELLSTSDPVPPGNGFPDPYRTDVMGAFKTPSLRNVELTGPYMHNGGLSTLAQVVEFYRRGGDFSHSTNFNNVGPLMAPIDITDAEADALVAFMLALTDERVRMERAPFDHPQLFVPDGRAASGSSIDLWAANRIGGGWGFEPGAVVVEVPAVGRAGRSGVGLPPLQPFLAADHLE